jgi:uncharacterized protein (TIGR03492 family)
MRPRLLCVSNGHGEDLIASEIIRHLRGVEAVAYPLVGLGDAYPEQVTRLGPRRVFPSGGFAFRHGLRNLTDDLRSGFIRFWFAQRRTLAGQRGRCALVLAVGDLYCLAMASLVGAPIVLVASADSVLNAPFGPLHLRRLRRHARQVFTRDAPTAESLALRGINAAYLGNVMLDCLHPTGSDFDITGDSPVVALLPGSRGDAVHNAVLLAEVASRVIRTRPEVRFVLSLAPTVDGDAVCQAIRDAGGRVQDGEAALGGARMVMTRAFADAIARAVVVVGLAGTANEQAAGLGKPVVAFPGPGPQFTAGFLEVQRRILGEALVAVSSPAEAGDAVLRLLASPEERARRGQAGMARMGSPGAGARIAAALEPLLTGAAASIQNG